MRMTNLAIKTHSPTFFLFSFYLSPSFPAVMATLSGITVFPIKSCHSVKVDSCRVDALGLAADRNFMLIEDDTNRFITQR